MRKHYLILAGAFSIISIVCFAVLAFAVDTTLDAPLTITNPATVMKQYSVTIIPAENKVRAQMQFIDSGGNVVQSRECEFTDATVTGAVVNAGAVGKKYVDVIAGAVQNKCKGLWDISGTDN